jgi:hypothetical protein
VALPFTQGVALGCYVPAFQAERPRNPTPTIFVFPRKWSFGPRLRPGLSARQHLAYPIAESGKMVLPTVVHPSSPKGWDVTAQGNALGHKREHQSIRPFALKGQN